VTGKKPKAKAKKQPSPAAKKKAPAKPATKKPKPKGAAAKSSPKPPKPATPPKAQARAALALATAPAPDAGPAPPFLSDVLCKNWVGLPTTIFVDGSLTLQTFWERNHHTPFTFNEQVSLANAIKSAYGKQFAPQSLTGGTTINTLAGWIPAPL
jgi:hypothetical protein